jgi:hypothetical protein
VCKSTFKGNTASTFAFPGPTPDDDVLVTEIHTKDSLIFSYETPLSESVSPAEHHKASIEAFEKEHA